MSTLPDYACPHCHSLDLRVEVKCVMHLRQDTQSGNIETDDNGDTMDHEWDETSPMLCNACDFTAPSEQFNTNRATWGKAPARPTGDRRVTSPQPRRQEVRRAEGFAGQSYGRPLGHPDLATMQSRRTLARRLGPPDRRSAPRECEHEWSSGRDDETDREIAVYCLKCGEGES